MDQKPWLRCSWSHLGRQRWIWLRNGALQKRWTSEWIPSARGVGHARPEWRRSGCARQTARHRDQQHGNVSTLVTVVAFNARRAFRECTDVFAYACICVRAFANICTVAEHACICARACTCSRHWYERTTGAGLARGQTASATTTATAATTAAATATFRPTCDDVNATAWVGKPRGKPALYIAPLQRQYKSACPFRKPADWRRCHSYGKLWWWRFWCGKFRWRRLGRRRSRRWFRWFGQRSDAEYAPGRIGRKFCS